MSSSLKRKRSVEGDEVASDDASDVPEGSSKSHSNGTNVQREPTSEDEEEGSDESSEEDEQESSQENTVNQEEEEKQNQGDQPAQQHDWQAIYSPAHNAYYFFNTKTQETTWSNPLEPASTAPNASISSSSDATNPNMAASSSTLDYPSGYQPIASTSGMANDALAQGYGYGQATTVNPALDGIDPELAYLDPSLSSGAGGMSGVPGGTGPVGTFSARFNAHTGRFTALDGRDPTHLSEYERMKRMSSVFFDYGAWEQEVAERKAREAEEEAEGRRRKKKPSKADLERFKAQKEARKKTKYAWLRE
ncbi:hypothetical protein FRC19_010007 [Serendipita sp. 401]|nr:hypothetical protein FRC19_010007 [Serendipita sp. 401]